ncbi:MAG: hypothetical protein ACRDLS_00530 [Solirubrobacteraceae bacterium]
MGRRGERKRKAITGDPADPGGFPVLVFEFLESMGVRGYSPRTIENHFVALGYLAAWLSERGITRPADVTKPMLDGYQRALFHRRKPDGTPLSFRAQHTRLVPIRAFFKWLARQNRILYNPASELELPKLERRLPRAVLSADEAERVLAVPEIADVGLRDRAMLELLYAIAPARRPRRSPSPARPAVAAVPGPRRPARLVAGLVRRYRSRSDDRQAATP